MNEPDQPARDSRRAPINHAQELTEETAQRLLSFLERSQPGRLLRANPGRELTKEPPQRPLSFLERSQPVRLLRASHVLSAVIGAVGFTLFVVGVEQVAQDIPIVSNAYR